MNAPVTNLRILPHSIDAEQNVLGGLMLAPDAWDRVASLLSDADFYRRDHQLIFRSIADLAAKNQPVDAVTLGEWFKSHGIAELVGGSSYVLQLANETHSAHNISAHAEIVKRKSLVRRVIDGCQQIVEEAFAKDVDPETLVDRAIGGLMKLQCLERSAEATVRQAVKAAWDHICAVDAGGGALPGIPTGLSMLDEHLGGFHPGDLIVIGARPAMGKTALLFGAARHAAAAGFPVGIISGEQPAEQLGMRMLALASSVPASRMRCAKFDDADWPALTDAVTSIQALPIRILDRASPSIAEVARVARKWKRENGIRGLYVDYLQLIEGPGEKRWEQVAAVTRGLKRIARELELPVIALAQVKREVETRGNMRPRMGDLCDSSEIEKEADQVLMIYRDEYYYQDSPDAGTAEIIIDKNRHGETAFCRVAWLAQTMRFADLEQGWQAKTPPTEPQRASRKFGNGAERGAERSAGADR